MIAASSLDNLFAQWYLDPICRLLVAAVLGSTIGIEREIHGRSAGFRTQLLVALGAALAMVVSLHFAHQFADANPGMSSLRIDPARMAYGVMGGIGFIGAGVIMHRETGVKGLTTSASLWCTAAVGLACGFGMYVVAVFTTFLVVFTLMGLSLLDRRIPSRVAKTVIVMLPPGETDSVERLRTALESRSMTVESVHYSRDFQANVETITAAIVVPQGADEAPLRSISEEIPELTHLTVR